ncbi:hypothetical protein B0H14DRAFT_3485568 [Mycena olivaceomarginata]|nr:hypothetical protein B0H14DRAFT_3485568 [Mycena olivaceomarginata]
MTAAPWRQKAALAAMAALSPCPLGVTHAHPIAVFLTCFPAIIPLAGLVSDATETISEKQRSRKWLGSFLNASLGNATELIISIIALFQGQTDITKLSLLGSFYATYSFIYEDQVDYLEFLTVLPQV